jgi:hypothetical protein
MPRIHARSLCTNEILFLSLLVLRGPVEGSIGVLHVSVLFGISGGVTNLFTHAVCAIHRSLKRLRPHLIEWPGPAKRRAMRGILCGFPQAIGFVDGTKAKAFRPTDPKVQELRYDGHHHFHAYSVLVWCNIFGDFILLDISLNGVDHDRMLFNNSAS